jgi:hypothetical protein
VATLEQLIDSKVPNLRTYNSLASPTPQQQTAIIKELVQAVAALIFIQQNRSDQTP